MENLTEKLKENFGRFKISISDWVSKCCKQKPPMKPKAGT